MLENLPSNKKEIARSNPAGIKSNSNIHNGLHEIREFAANRPTTAAENTLGKPPRDTSKKHKNKEPQVENYQILMNKQRLTLSNAMIASKDSAIKLSQPNTASSSRKAAFSPISHRPVTYNCNPILGLPRKPNPRAMSLPRKSEDIIITEGLLNYTIKKILGKGAYATVRLAQHNETSKKVAIKTYDKYQIIDPTKRANMLREIEILKKLDHPNIIKLYETVDTPKHFHLVLEYVSGLSLYTYIKSKPNSCLDETEAKRIFKQILGALDYCHCRSIAHRDIKLDNILLDEKNNVKIIDFGFSTMNSNDEKSRIFCGTPSYMAPEIVGRKDYYGMQADVWALGILLYAMLCGKMPFKAYNDKELYRRIEKGNFTLPNTVPECFKKVISKMLEVNPKKRPSIKALLDDEWPSSGGNYNWNIQNYVSRSTCETNSLDLEIISGIVNYN